MMFMYKVGKNALWLCWENSYFQEMYIEFSADVWEPDVWDLASDGSKQSNGADHVTDHALSMFAIIHWSCASGGNKQRAE